MNVTDLIINLIIIYLACGSPFAVFQVTKRDKVDWLGVVSSFLFWPAYAVKLLGERIFSNEARIKSELRNRLEDLRLDIESVVFKGESISLLFEFREIYARFTGLSEAADAAQDKSRAEIFEISGHQNKSLASRCLARRNAGRLAFHRTIAREDFVELISRLTASIPNGNELEHLSVELAELLQDGKAVESFASMTSVTHVPERDEVLKSRAPATFLVRTGNDSDRVLAR